MRPFLRILPALAPICLCLPACTSVAEPVPDVAGRLRVVALATGDDLPDAVYFSVDGGLSRAAFVNSMIDLGPLSSGEHVVQLAPVPEQCDLSGTASRFITIVPNQTLDVSFAMACHATGIELDVRTIGLDVPSIYLVQIGSSGTAHVSSNGVYRRTKLPAGTYPVTLGPLSDNCLLSTVPPQVQVTARQVVRVVMNFQCVARSGVLQVFVATSGQDPDQNGFLVFPFGAGSTSQVLPNETLNWHLNPGRYPVTLSGVASNCRLLGPATQVVEIEAGLLVRDTVPIRYEVECVRTEKLAFVEGELIMVTYLDGSESTALSPGSDPDWAPNGFLAFHARTCPWFSGPPLSNYSGDWPPPEPCIEHGLWVASGPPRPVARMLTTNPSDMHPAWRPDGEMIAFERQGTLRLIRPDGTGDIAVGVIPTVLRASQPSWSPDGTRLAFTCEVQLENLDVYIVQPDGAGFQRLTSTMGPDSDPDWGPNGTIAFTTQRFSGRDAIALLNPADGTVTFLGSGRSPAWSADGTRLAWAVSGLGIHVFGLTSGSSYFINRQESHGPAWRP